MLIWSHSDAGYGYIALLFVLFSLLPLGGLLLYLRNCFLPAMRDPENKHWLARTLFSIPIVLILVFQGFFLRIPVMFADFYSTDRHALRGEVELISYAEDWGRYFNGYTVVLTVDGTEFTSLDAFPKEVVDRLAEGGQMEITYVKLDDGGTYVWEIKSIP